MSIFTALLQSTAILQRPATSLNEALVRLLYMYAFRMGHEQNFAQFTMITLALSNHGKGAKLSFTDDVANLVNNLRV